MEQSIVGRKKERKKEGRKEGRKKESTEGSKK